MRSSVGCALILALVGCDPESDTTLDEGVVGSPGRVPDASRLADNTGGGAPPACATGTWDDDGDSATPCAAWSDCGPGQHVTTPGNATQDRTCSACVSGTYNTEQNARLCTGWTTCSAGRYVSAAGSASSDQVCADCADGTYTSGIDRSACVARGECEPGSVQTTPGSATAPPSCESCSAGNYCAGGTAPVVTCAAGSWDHDAEAATDCVAKTDCLAGEYVVDEGAATSDRSCAACDNESYSSDDNLDSCSPRGECAPGYEQTAAGSSTAPTTCAACSIGSYCAGGDAPAVPCSGGAADDDDDPATECVADSSYGATVLADSPYIFWRMNETSGTTMLDSSGNGRDGSYSGGITFGAAGIAGAAVTFDGSSGAGNYLPVETVSGTFSVELWVKPTQDSHTVLFTTWGVSGGSQFDFQRYNGHPHGDIGTGSSWLTTAADSATPIPLDEWTHLVYVVTPSGWTIYQNNVVANSDVYSGTPLLFDTTTPLTVAAHGSSLFLGGTLDEVAIYTTALSPERVAAHYAAASL
jgi:hypothetical protein